MKKPNLRECLLFLAALALQACAGRSGGSISISGTGGTTSTGAGGSVGTGSGGASGVHCTTTACVPALTTALTWDVEIAPPSMSGAAFTQLTDFDLYRGGAPLTLTADVPATVATMFTVPANVSAPSSANVVLTVPSSIPGGPDLTFQGPAVVSTGLTAAVTVPQLLLGKAATMALSPLPPADQQSPSYSFSVTLATVEEVGLPANNVSIGGRLTTAVAMAPTSSFVARAFQNGTQISNAPLTTTAGAFNLLIPSAAAANGMPLTIQLTPQSQTDPWFTTDLSPPFPSSQVTIMLPAYGNLNQFNLLVEGPDGASEPVSGALVQVQALIGMSAVGSTNAVGSANFARSGLTNGQGLVSLSLLPGSAQAELKYAVVVTPPSSSPYATTCAAVGVTVGGSTVNTASAPTEPPILVPLRPVVTGTVTDSHGYPVANVNVSATPGPAPTCASTPPSAGSTTTVANGTFSLPLDPGTYQLDYDPPSGAAAPRLTELAVVVAPGVGELSHSVTLPAGALVVGSVVANDKTPLPSATVRLYEPRCSTYYCTGTPPWLRGQTVTDANGQFRVVVPLPN
jgi:hypothetical protein